MSATPSLGGGTNYAFGGARTSGPGIGPSIVDQFVAWNIDTGGTADSDGLYVVWGGGNNVRDIASGATPPADLGVAVADIFGIVAGLRATGANNIMVPNLPGIGQLPRSSRQREVIPC